MNNLPNIWTQSPELSVKGPILRSVRRHPELDVLLDYMECTVGNKSTFTPTFGYLAEIENERNINRARLKCWVAPAKTGLTLSDVTTPSNINGFWEQTGTKGGKPKYALGFSGWEIYWNNISLEWFIQPGTGSGITEYFSHSSDTPTPPTTGWTGAGGAVGSPAIALTTEGRSFPTATRRMHGISELHCEGYQTTRMVSADAEPDSGDGVWESVVEPYDDAHGMLVTTYITSSPTRKRSRWIEQFNQFIEVEESMVQSPLSTAPSFDSGSQTYTSYEHERCDWYVKRVEKLSGLATLTYKDSLPYYFPPVLTFLEVAAVMAEWDDNGTTREYIHHVTADVRFKEAYNGLCDANVTKTFEVSSTGTSVSPKLIPDAFRYEGIFFNLSVPECLHTTRQFTETVGTHHPRYTNQVRQKTYPGTAQTDWTSVTVTDHEPFMGGYIKTVTVYSPPS